MASEIDPNTIISNFVEARFQDLLSVLNIVAKNVSTAVRSHFRSGYEKYIRTAWERHSTCKSFFIRNETSFLYDFYIPLGIGRKREKIQNPEIMHFTKGATSSILLAPAGSGKSMFMKHLFLNAIITKDRIPIFIELRRLNDSDKGLVDFIHNHISTNSLAIERPAFERGLSDGVFVILLDGLDEVDLKRREALTKEIFSIQSKFPQTHVIISSRPDSTIESWPGFSTSKLLPLSLVQSINLIKKLPFDEEIKSQFVKDLEKSLYQKHESFASNPLLLSIMLLTYSQSLGIPDKLSVFYNQAYEALFERHDALKGGFTRRRQTELDIHDFARIFSAFCLYSYDKGKSALPRSECLELIEKSVRLCNLECSKSQFLFDARESVGLLVEDGLLLTFPHRSFQEYFTARFIASAPTNIEGKLALKFSGRIMHDNVLKLLYEMRPDIVESFVILPLLQSLFKKIKLSGASPSLLHHHRYLKILVDKIIVQANGHPSFSVNESIYLSVVWFCTAYCMHLVDREAVKGVQVDGERRDFLSFNSNTFKTSALTRNHPAIKQIAASNGIFSLKGLGFVISVAEAIKRRQKAMKESLDDVLGGG